MALFFFNSNLEGWAPHARFQMSEERIQCSSNVQRSEDESSSVGSEQGIEMTASSTDDTALPFSTVWKLGEGTDYYDQSIVPSHTS